MILGVGVDIVKIERFAGLSAKPRFMKKVFSPQEQEYLQSKGAAATASMAGIFAAKEAVAKALSTGFREFLPCDIEIVQTPHGKPYVILHNKAKTLLDKFNKSNIGIEISISHSETDAIAFAIVQG